MRTLKLLLLIVLSTGFLMSIGCKKGDTGPAGPAGPDSVYYSKWTALSMKDEGLDTSSTSPTDGYEIYDEDFPASGITSAILNKGAVLTYFQAIDNNNDTLIVNGADVFFDQYFYVGDIYLASAGADYTGAMFRYVAVPGTISVTSVSGEVKTYTAKELASMSYKAVAGLLNISATGSKLK